MRQALLNTITKVLTFVFEDVSYELDLKEGDLEDNWQAIKTKKGIYDTNFSWDESDDLPSFALYPLKMEKDFKTGGSYVTTDTEKGISYTVVLERGSKEDFFGVDFPNGFLSFSHTLSVIMRDAPSLPNYDSYVGRNGAISFLDEAKKWAFEFENYYSGVKWGIDEIHGDWEETLWKFIQKKMNEL